MGVSTHSKPITLYIFSTFLKDRNPLENEESHKLLGDYLDLVGTSYVQLEGQYAGFKELSYLATANTLPEEAVRVITQQGKQESYLVAESHKHGTYKATLVDVKSGNRNFIGYLRELSKDIIDEFKLDYSYRKDINKYFAVWPTDTTVMESFEHEIAQAKLNGLDSIGKGKLATV